MNDWLPVWSVPAPALRHA